MPAKHNLFDSSPAVDQLGKFGKRVGYCAGTGVRPAFRIVGAASGDARKRIRALAASGCRAVVVSAPAKETSG